MLRPSASARRRQSRLLRDGQGAQSTRAAAVKQRLENVLDDVERQPAFAKGGDLLVVESEIDAGGPG